MKQKKLFSSLYAIITRSSFAFVLFFAVGIIAHAQTSAVWYVNPAGRSCTPVDASYDQTTLPSGWTFEEFGCNWETMSGCTYQICSPATNDTYNEVGAVASFGASINKSNYAPGELGSVTIIGSLGSHTGSNLANALLFYNLGNPFLNSITCFFFSCPVTRQVHVTANVPFADAYGDPGNYPEPPAGDPNGYGYQNPIYNRCSLDTGACYSWMGFEPQFSMNQKGSIYGIKTFKVPSVPGTYNVDLWGAHEKYYGVVPASLTFTVGPAAPTININFSYHEVLRKVKSWFE